MIPLLNGHLKGRRVRKDPSVVHEHINLPVALEYCFDKLLEMLILSDVALVKRAPVVSLGQRIHHSFAVLDIDISQSEGGARFAQALGNGQAKPAGRASNQSHLAVEPVDGVESGCLGQLRF
jgi:hypothetical protein